MAFAFKIKEIRSSQQTTDPDGSTTTIDYSLSGRMLVVVDYVDTAAPNTVLHTERFILPATETEAQITEHINAFGRMVRDSRIRVAGLQQYVNSVVAITDPPTEV